MTHPVPTPSADELVKLLNAYADDPMWADHAEVNKAVLRKAAARILALESQLARMGEALRLSIAAMKRTWTIVAPFTSGPSTVSGAEWLAACDQLSAALAAANSAAEALSSTPVQPGTGIREAALEEAAKVADAHKGQAARDRKVKGHSLSMATLAYEEIVAEERGENIAAEMIAAAIRKLKPRQHAEEE